MLVLYSLLIFLQMVSIESWNSGLKPKRDLNLISKNILNNRKLLVGAGYVINRVVLGFPKESSAAELAPAPSSLLLQQRVNSIDSQAYLPGIQLKDVYYPSW
jgi:hypothetical protein